MFSCGWLWLYFGAFLMLAELVSPGFVIFFFGLSAVTVGLLRFAFGDAFTLAWQLASFSVLAIAYLFLLRRWVSGIFTGLSATSKTDFDNELVGRTGRIVAAVRPGLAGRVLIGDAEWNAVAEESLDVGADVRVVAASNLTVSVVSA